MSDLTVGLVTRRAPQGQMGNVHIRHGEKMSRLRGKNVKMITVSIFCPGPNPGVLLLCYTRHVSVSVRKQH